MGVHHHKSPIVTDGLVFHIDAGNIISSDETSETVNSIVNPSNTGTLFNELDMIQNGSFVFDGSDDFIDFGYIPELDLSKFTVSLWVYRKSGGGSTLIDKRTGSGTDDVAPNFAIDWNSTIINPYCSNGSVLKELVFSTSSFEDKWSKIDYTYDNTTGHMKLYFNSLLVEDNIFTPFTPTTSGFQPLVIGRSNLGGGSNWINDEISSVQIYNKALSVKQIKQNYESQKQRFENL